MTAEQHIAGPLCHICDEHFIDKSALAKHLLGKKLKRHPRCQECRKTFSSEDARIQHNAAKHASTVLTPSPVANAPMPSASASQTNAASIPTPQPKPTIRYRENDYSILSLLDATNAENLLKAQRHSADCLVQHGYFLADVSGMTFHCSKQLDAPTTVFFRSPSPSFLTPKRKAVVLDCAMVGCIDGRDEAVQLCALDFFTGEVLINSIVKPWQQIIDWRTKITGLSPADMAIAMARGQTLVGSAGARQELWKHIDENTILIGQSLNFDLNVLGVSHATVVDSQIITSTAVFKDRKVGRRWGLQQLCKDILGLEIRQGAGTIGHDSMEDSLSIRELVLRCLLSPVSLESWAEKAKKSFLQERQNRRGKRKRPVKKPSRTPGLEQDFDDWYGQDDENEVLLWSDVIDYDMWPASPPSD
ncbi:hypothetical protein PFICI_00019 [Pestalotiopsis fici W106-1]|uniref:C2H2-type domain-containing protein n=1 Tax=Pestalotiopsis fici (strain W106-1 / CGMCC3.15140) TaxID=1229662 RepID=W3XLQ5_PESFW|nr:uncharacterized protein PFICI_00019 [Pestalotiopsis fici W106-1]ETS86191.1 hypothetical protein PFICI_00019 [Pestalotiopsis fici W106-1]